MVHTDELDRYTCVGGGKNEESSWVDCFDMVCRLAVSDGWGFLVGTVGGTSPSISAAFRCLDFDFTSRSSSAKTRDTCFPPSLRRSFSICGWKAAGSATCGPPTPSSRRGKIRVWKTRCATEAPYRGSLHEPTEQMKLRQLTKCWNIPPITAPTASPCTLYSPTFFKSSRRSTLCCFPSVALSIEAATVGVHRITRPNPQREPTRSPRRYVFSAEALISARL